MFWILLGPSKKYNFLIPPLRNVHCQYTCKNKLHFTLNYFPNPWHCATQQEINKDHIMKEPNCTQIENPKRRLQ